MPCVCPISGVITSISNVDCYEKFGAIEKAFLFRKTANGISYISNPKFDGVAATPNDIREEASWDAFLTAIDDEKIVGTPLFTNTATAGGDERTFGGNDNTTVGGAAISVGVNFVDLTFEFQDLPGYIIEELRALTCENVMVILIDEFGSIIAKELNGLDSNQFTGFEVVSAPFVGGKTLGGRTEPNRNAMSLKLRGEWDSGLRVVQPNFDIYNKLNP